MGSRFMSDLNGKFGEYWVREAKKELERVRQEVESGNITIDENGVARNSIGRVLMSDMLEKVAYLGYPVDVEATAEARISEVARSVREYNERQARRSDAEREEHMRELRAAFGPGQVIVDVLSGERYEL